MKRRIIQLVLLLVAGAIVNVAVAWGCISVSNPSGRHRQPTAEEKAWLTDFGWVPPKHPNGMQVKLLTFDREDYGVVWLEFRESADVMRDSEGEFIEPSESLYGYSYTERLIGYQSRAGLPCLALQGGITLNFAGKLASPMYLPMQKDWAIHLNRPSAFLPYGPIWPGFAINTTFYAAILWMVFFAPGMVKRTLRRRRGQCPACAYPVGTSSVCTECGGPVGKRPNVQTSKRPNEA